MVFSQFVSMLKILKSALDEDRVRYEYLDGLEDSDEFFRRI